MPTTEPLELDGDFGGPLNQIAAMHTAAPATPAAPRATASTAMAGTAAHAAQAAAHSTGAAPHAPAFTGAVIHGLRTNLHTPGVSLRHGIEHPAEEKRPDTTTTATLRNETFSDEAFGKAWNAFIDANPTQHIIINTMRACPPTRKDASSTHYTMKVENNLQEDQMENVLSLLLRHLHDTLANDNITLDFMVKDAADSPMSWNQREVLAHIIDKHPRLRELIDTLELKLD